MGYRVTDLANQSDQPVSHPHLQCALVNLDCYQGDRGFRPVTLLVDSRGCLVLRRKGRVNKKAVKLKLAKWFKALQLDYIR
jgi:hypothetical protein